MAKIDEFINIVKWLNDKYPALAGGRLQNTASIINHYVEDKKANYHCKMCDQGTCNHPYHSRATQRILTNE